MLVIVCSAWVACLAVVSFAELFKLLRLKEVNGWILQLSLAQGIAALKYAEDGDYVWVAIWLLASLFDAFLVAFRRSA